MKYLSVPLLLLFITLVSCSEDNDVAPKQVTISLNFNHNWNQTQITNADFNEIKFTNANGEELSIAKLRYLISNLTFTNQNGAITKFSAYNLVDLTNAESLIFSLPETISVGTYSSVKFTFGFNAEENIDGAYPDLNTASFDVPANLGGGYHYMQLEGKFINSHNETALYTYHTISAIDKTNPANTTTTLDTSFEVDLGEMTINNDQDIEIKMDVSEWFKNPNIWDLNFFSANLMGNYDAQIKMNANGKNAFSLGVIQE